MAKLNPEDLLTSERVFSTKELAGIAKHFGWKYERTKGSHKIFSRIGWKDNLSIPVHREYEWGVAKSILHKILAPVRDQVPEHPAMIRQLEHDLAQLWEHAKSRITAYENKKMEEALLLEEFQNSSSIMQDLEMRLAQTEQALSHQIEQTELQRNAYEDRLSHASFQAAKELESIHYSLLQNASTESSQLTQQVDQLRRERDQTRKARALERMIAGVGLGVLSAITLGTLLTRFTCEPAQKSLSPPSGAQPQLSR